MMADRDRSLAQSRPGIASIALPGTLIIAVPNASGKFNDYYMSVDRGPFFCADRLPGNVSQERARTRLANVVAQYRERDEDNPGPASFSNLVVGFPWQSGERFAGEPTKTNLTAMAASLAATAQRRSVIALEDDMARYLAIYRAGLSRDPKFRYLDAEARRQEVQSRKRSQQERRDAAQEASRDAVPELASALRTRWRAPEKEVLRAIARRLDRSALVAMRAARDFDPRHYTWLSQPSDQEIRRRRGAFSRQFPVLAPLAYRSRGIEAHHLTSAIDIGIDFSGKEGLQRLAVFVCEGLGGKLSAETVIRYVRLSRMGLPRAEISLIAGAIHNLDRIPADKWPMSTAGLQVFSRTMNELNQLPRQPCFDGLKARIRTGQGPQWDTFAARVPHICGIDDLENAIGGLPAYARAVVAGVILPRQFIRTGEAPRISAAEQDRLASDMLASAPLDQLIEASEAWHRTGRRHQLKQALHALGGTDEGFIRRVPPRWLPLMASTAVPDRHFKGRPMAGLQVEELTCEAEIDARRDFLGLKAETCKAQCLQPPGFSNPITRHLFIVTEQSGPRSAFMLTARDQSNHSRYLIEPAASSERKTPPRHLAAVQSLMAGLLSGQVEEAYPMTARRQRLERMAATRFEREIGCDIRRPDIARDYFAQWAPFLPPSLRDVPSQAAVEGAPSESAVFLARAAVGLKRNDL